ncbi:MAG: ParB/RepB/Spo0J family partition protein [Candidatus Coatesbacteria bacterium]|nr:ParB/RepB/Spo0J family partition protein [Candidatus Coatesbacteria bacterium]
MKEKKRLGRGLEAILGDSIADSERPSIIEIDLDLLTPNRAQPRVKFDKEELAGLADSIKSKGLVQPILVRRIEDGYEIVVGERRWRAAQLAGLSRIPAIVKDLSTSDLLATALIENIQRSDLNPLEIGAAFENLLKEAGLSHAEVAEQVGMSRSSVTNHLRLLALPESIKEDLMEQKISMGHARALLSLPSASKQRALADLIIAKGLSVRKAEELARRLIEPASRSEKIVSTELLALQDQLCAMLGTRVTIKGGQKGTGRITIEYYSDDDLDRLLSILRH